MDGLVSSVTQVTQQPKLGQIQQKVQMYTKWNGYVVWFTFMSSIFIFKLYMLTSELAFLKFRHGISLKCSQYRDTY